MAKVDISSYTFPAIWKFGGTKAKLRLYATEQFVASDDTIIMPSDIDNSGWYREIICTVAGSVLTIPTITDIDSTTDSTKPTAGYVGVFFNSRGDQCSFFADREFRIPPLPGATTWADLIIFNQAQASAQPDTYLTALQVYALFNNLDLAPDATDLIKGKVLIETGGSGVAVSDNSPLLTFAATKEDAGHALLDVDPDNPAIPLVPGINSPQITKNTKVLGVDYASLAAAVTAIGATPTTLKIKSDITVSANTNLTASGVILDFADGAKITVASGITLTIDKMVDPGNRQVFAQQSATANIRFAPGAVNFINIAWFVGATATLCTNAINQAIASCAANGGGHIFFPEGDWTTAGNHAACSNLVISGVGTTTTSIKATATNVGIFKHTAGIYDVTVRDLALDGDSLSGVSGYLCTGAYPADAAAGQARFENVLIANCTYGFRIHDTTSTEWQMANVSFDAKCHFRNNTYAIWCNSINNVLQCDAFFASTHNQYIAKMEQAGQWTFTGEFAGFPAQNGASQVESQTVVAAAGVTADGIGQSIVTAAGMAGSPATVNVPLNTVEHTTAAAVTDAFRKALSNDPKVASFFHICGTGADIQLIPIDNVADDATMNFTINTGTATGVTNSATSTNTVAGVASTVNAIGFWITGAHGTLNFLNTQDEGFTSFLVNDAADANSIINFYGASIQSPVRLNQYAIVNTSHCHVAPKAIRDGAGARYMSNGDLALTSAFLGGAFRTIAYPRTNNFAGFDTTGKSGLIVDETSHYLVRKFSQYARRLFRNENHFGIPSADAMYELLSTYPSNTEWTQLRIGRCNSMGAPDAYYDFLRTVAGRLRIEGNDVGRGLDFNGDIEATGFSAVPVTLTSSATIAMDAAEGDFFILEPDDDATLNIDNLRPGQTITLFIRTINTTSRTLTFGTNFVDEGVLTTGTSSDRRAVMKFDSDGVSAVEYRRTMFL